MSGMADDPQASGADKSAAQSGGRQEVQQAKADADAEADQAMARRLAEDAAEVTRLADAGFAGRPYQDFEERLIRYARALLTAWLLSGEIFARCRAKGMGLPGPARLPAHEDCGDMAADTLVHGLRDFRRRALVDGGWKPEDGARLDTSFVDGLLEPFANAYRGWNVQAQREVDELMRRDPEATEADLQEIAADPATSDPQEIVMRRSAVQEALGALADTTARVLVLGQMGYRPSEIAELMDMTPSAVEETLRRHRSETRSKEDEPDA
ncbi:MAG: Sigma-70 region 4 type 2 [Actinoallomurus sp.]|nr:Sigma-70 region 4 type 2 [Actinoallomurus sp.]